MKISTKVPADHVAVGTESHVLFEGDTVTASLTHHIKISGDDSWVKFEATSRVQPEESADAARKRITGFALDASLEAVMETVEAIRKIQQ